MAQKSNIPKSVYSRKFPGMYRPALDQRGASEGQVRLICTGPTFDHESCPHCEGKPSVIADLREASP